MNLSLRCRYASLVAFCEARDRQLELSFGDDNCGRQEGGKFGANNSCQADGGQGLSEAIRAGRQEFAGDDVPREFGKAASVSLGDPKAIQGILGDLAGKGMTLDKAMAMAPGSQETGAKVVVTGLRNEDGSGQVQAISDVPVGGAGRGHSVRVKTQIEQFTNYAPTLRELGGGGDGRSTIKSALHLDLLKVAPETQDLIVKAHNLMAVAARQTSLTPRQTEEMEEGLALERQIGSKMVSMMTKAIAAAQEGGLDAVYTYAAGSGDGQATNLGDDPSNFRGYALWGRFGLDGKVDITDWRIEEKLSRLADLRPGDPEREILTEASWSAHAAGKGLMLQDFYETKPGERFWRKHGTSINLSMDLKDKDSKGWKKFARLQKAANRAGDSREFFDWLSAEHRSDPFDFFHAERRNCGTGGGGFQKGNTCAGQLAADVAKGSLTGAAAGAAVAAGQTLGYPPAALSGAATGAAIGAVKGLYDNRMRPTRAGKAIAAIGSSDKEVAVLVKALGGTPKSVAEATGRKSVSIAIKDQDGKTSYEVAMTAKVIRVTPAAGKKAMTTGEIAKIKSLAKGASQKNVEVLVDRLPASTLAKFAKAGASLALNTSGAFVASFVVPMVPALAGTAIELTTGLDIEKTLRGRR